MPVCARGAIRNVQQTEKFAVEREYGLAAAYYGYSMRIDQHGAARARRGERDRGVSSREERPGELHVKDALENRAKAWVCEGRLSMAAARRGFATNWETLYGVSTAARRDQHRLHSSPGLSKDRSAPVRKPTERGLSAPRKLVRRCGRQEPASQLLSREPPATARGEGRQRTTGDRLLRSAHMDHVFVIMMENTSYDDLLSPSNTNTAFIRPPGERQWAGERTTSASRT